MVSLNFVRPGSLVSIDGYDRDGIQRIGTVETVRGNTVTLRFGHKGHNTTPTFRSYRRTKIRRMRVLARHPN